MTPQEIETALSKINDALEAMGLDGSVTNYVQDELDKLDKIREQSAQDFGDALAYVNWQQAGGL